MQNKWRVLSFRYELYTGREENVDYIGANLHIIIPILLISSYDVDEIDLIIAICHDLRIIIIVSYKWLSRVPCIVMWHMKIVEFVAIWIAIFIWNVSSCIIIWCHVSEHCTALEFLVWPLDWCILNRSCIVVFKAAMFLVFAQTYFRHVIPCKIRR